MMTRMVWGLVPGVYSPHVTPPGAGNVSCAFVMLASCHRLVPDRVSEGV